MLRKFRAAWPFDAHDLLALVGLILLSTGCWLVSPALALIVAGALVIAFAFVSALPPRTGT